MSANWVNIAQRAHQKESDAQLGHFTTKLGYKMNQDAYPVQQATIVMQQGT